MEFNEIIEKLEKKTKSELVDMIKECIISGEIEVSKLEKYITAEDFCLYEKNIVDKLNNKNDLTQDELNYIKERLEKRAKTKISTVLNGNKKFDAFIVNMKLKDYFNTAWKYYPRKVGKVLGEKSFIKLFNDKNINELNSTAKYILSKIIYYRKYCEEKETDEQYILHFSTFCNSKKYL